LTGVFMQARELRDRGDLADYECDWLNEVFDWFNCHLPVPPFRRNLWSKRWSANAVCWYRDDAKEPLSRMWDIVAMLREHGVPVRLITTQKPGRIVFEDKFQVVAETPYWA